MFSLTTVNASHQITSFDLTYTVTAHVSPPTSAFITEKVIQLWKAKFYLTWSHHHKMKLSFTGFKNVSGCLKGEGFFYYDYKDSTIKVSICEHLVLQTLNRLYSSSTCTYPFMFSVFLIQVTKLSKKKVLYYQNLKLRVDENILLHRSMWSLLIWCS